MFGLKNPFRKAKKSASHVEAVFDDGQPTSQVSIDTEVGAWFNLRERLLVPPYALSPFLTLFETDPLAHSLIEAATNLVVSEIACVSESDELCEYVNEFNERVGLEETLTVLAKDMHLYGFAAAEVTGDGSTLLNSNKITELKRLDPRFLVVIRDRHGVTQIYLQSIGFGGVNQSLTPPAGLTLSFQHKLDPQTIIYISTGSPRTVYGHPLLQSVKSRLEERNTLITAAVQAAKAHANPVNFVNYITDNSVDKDEAAKQRELLSQVCKNIDKDKTRWLVAASDRSGQYDSAVLGHSTLPDITPLIDSLTQDIISSAGLSASALGFNLNSKGVTTFDSSNRQAIANIVVKQRRLVSQLNRKLYRLLPFIESDTPDGLITVRMEEPDLDSVKTKQESATIAVNNAILKARAGIISGQGVATELGHKDLADEDRFNDFIKQEQGEVNSSDPNDVQQQRQAILSKGKDPGNNPTGGK